MPFKERKMKTTKRMNIKYVAETANVSVATVSRVLNKSGYVKKETCEHVQKIINDLGYRRNSLAKSLRSLKSQYIALIVPDIENEYFAAISRWIEHYLQRQGYGVFISSIEQSSAKAQWYANLYVDHFVAGAILLTDDNTAIESLCRANIPIVVADRLEDKKNRKNVSFIGSDNFSGGFTAAQTLIKHQAKRILLLRDAQNLSNVNEREQGFLKAVQSYQRVKVDFKIMPIKVCRNSIYNRIYEIYQEWPFDGLFATSDYIAIAAMGGLINKGLKIPAHIQMIGYDGVPSANFTAPSLATISQSLDEFGIKIAQVMVEMIENRDYQVDLLLPIKLHDGESLKPI